MIKTLKTEYPILGNGYVPGPGGLGPRYWRCEITGRLATAVRAYFNAGQKPMTAPELEMVCEYIKHWAHAPCWKTCEKLEAAQAATKNMRTIEEMRQVVSDLLALGIDPF